MQKVATNGLPQFQPTDRLRVVEGWKAPRSGTLINIEVARKEDRQLLLNFMNEQTRLQEPIISSTDAQVSEISNVFKGILDRSVDSGLTLMMFKVENNELIGIRMTSIAKMPKEPVTGEFKLLPDYKDLIDRQPGTSRKDKQIAALCELMYSYGPAFIPSNLKSYVCMELINMKPEYRGDGLATKLYQELFKLSASKGYQFAEVLCTARASQAICHKLGLDVKLQVDYDKFVDNGEVCFKNTNDKGTCAQLLIGDLKKLGYFN